MAFKRVDNVPVKGTVLLDKEPYVVTAITRLCIGSTWHYQLSLSRVSDKSQALLVRDAADLVEVA